MSIYLMISIYFHVIFMFVSVYCVFRFSFFELKSSLLTCRFVCYQYAEKTEEIFF